jgi:hypothetical protein
MTYLHILHKLGHHGRVVARLLETGHANVHVFEGFLSVLRMTRRRGKKEACHEGEDGGSSEDHCLCSISRQCLVGLKSSSCCSLTGQVKVKESHCRR